jgi:hypothetical protein
MDQKWLKKEKNALFHKCFPDLKLVSILPSILSFLKKYQNQLHLNVHMHTRTTYQIFVETKICA